MSKRQMQEEKPGKEERVVAKIETNDEFGVRDSNSTGFECI